MTEVREQSSASIAFVHHRGEFDTVPSLMGAVRLLVRDGNTVDLIYVSDPAFDAPSFDVGEVRLVVLPSLRRFPLPASIRRIFEALLLLMATIWQSAKRGYSWLVGVDPVGLIISGTVATIFRAQFFYFNLEILFASELTSFYIRIIKVLERYFNRRSAFSVIQDQSRAEMLARENQIPLDTILLLPNSPAGEARPRRSLYLRNKLGIADDQSLILHVGTLSKWTCTPELISASRRWPDQLALVLHSRQRGDELSFDWADHPWVKVSEGPVPSQVLPELIASADVGLVLYRRDDHFMHGDNIEYVGLSSGKMAEYLRCGVPVVVTAFPGLCEIVEQYRCGICVDGVDDLAGAIRGILADRAQYSQGAIRCFNEVFRFEHKFEAVLMRLNHDRA